MENHVPSAGDSAPDFTIKTPEGKLFTLGKELKKRNVMLVFHRGHWCPISVSRLAEVRDAYPRIIRTNTRVYAISTDNPEPSAALAAEMHLPFTLLCDTDKQAIQAFGLLNTYEHGGIARPATFIVKPSGVVGYRSLDNPIRRADMEHVIYYLQSLSRNPDYLLEAPFSAKEWTFLDRPTIRQVARNMVLRGNRADWSHYVFYPVEMLRMAAGTVIGRKGTMKEEGSGKAERKARI